MNQEPVKKTINILRDIRFLIVFITMVLSLFFSVVWWFAGLDKKILDNTWRIRHIEIIQKRNQEEFYETIRRILERLGNDRKATHQQFISKASNGKNY